MKLFRKKNQPQGNSLLEEGYKLRDNLWSSVGHLHDDVIAPIINPGLVGLPMWPNLRQSIRVIELENGNTILATDGLSDQFSDSHPMKSDASGFEIEFYILTDEKLTPSTAAKSWQMSVLYQLGLQCAHAGTFRQLLDKYIYLSIELYDTSLPKNYQNEGRVGVLLGIESSTVPPSCVLPSGEAKLVSVVVLTPEETVICAKGESSRNELAKRIRSERIEPISTLK